MLWIQELHEPDLRKNVDLLYPLDETLSYDVNKYIFELMSSSDRYILLLFELSCLRNKSTKDVSQANALTVDLFHLSISFYVGACHQFWVWQLILVMALV